MTQHFNDHRPQKFPSTATKTPRLRPLHLLPPDVNNDLDHDKLITHPGTTRPDNPLTNVAANSYTPDAQITHAGYQLPRPDRVRRRTLKIRQQIALGATCGLLLMAFISIIHYEQEKNNPVISNTATSYQPTQTEPSTPLAQHTALPQTGLNPTHVPPMEVPQPTPTVIPTQIASTPLPIQTTSTPLPAQTTPQTNSTPLTKSAYIAIAQSDAKKVGINPNYFVKQIQLESGFNPDAQGSGGAIGIAQFMPETAKGLGIDPTDPLASLNAAANMMANLAHQFNNDYAKALAAYNLGSESVENAEQTGGTNWLAQLPESTQNYIHEITS